jgi:hypothetical protein
MRRESFAALWPLFAKATKPAKELTESFSALEHLRPLIARVGSSRVIHVGDGAHARTAALFALKTETENISVDPLINVALVDAWRNQFAVERFSWRKSAIARAASALNALPEKPVFVTFVHAHVSVDESLAGLRWDAAYTLACCIPGHQLSARLPIHVAGEDWGVLSCDRTFQVLINPESQWADKLAARAAVGVRRLISP